MTGNLKAQRARNGKNWFGKSGENCTYLGFQQQNLAIFIFMHITTDDLVLAASTFSSRGFNQAMQRCIARSGLPYGGGSPILHIVQLLCIYPRASEC
jgi:hypothetical protein